MEESFALVKKFLNRTESDRVLFLSKGDFSITMPGFCSDNRVTWDDNIHTNKIFCYLNGMIRNQCIFHWHSYSTLTIKEKTCAKDASCMQLSILI